MSAERPPRAVLGILVAFILAPPLVSALGFGEAFGFRMFSRLERGRMELVAIDREGARTTLPVARLLPHLGRDARRVLVPAERSVVGEVSVESLAEAGAEIAELGCAVDDDALTIEVTVVRESLAGAPIDRQRTERRCRR